MKKHIDYDFLYFYGPSRRKNNSNMNLDSQIRILQHDQKGSELIKDLQKIYESDFKKYPHSDDGYIAKVINENVCP